MVQLIIKGKSERAKKFIEFARTMDFIEFVESNKKSKILNEIEAGLKEVKLIQEGKLKKKTLKEVLDGKQYNSNTII